MILPVLAMLCCLCFSAVAADLGLFEGDCDIGLCAKPGSASFEKDASAYTLSGGGDNMWFTNDAFHFLWKRVSGDFSLEAAVKWLHDGGNPHRKACLMVRQSLAPDSAYVDVAVHGDGLTSLQFRESSKSPTREVQANFISPRHVGIERQGNVFFMSAAESGGEPRPTGAAMRVAFTDPVYVGLGVCAHDNAVVETARFNDVILSPKSWPPDVKAALHSTLEIVRVDSKDRRVVYHSLEHIEAPNWSRDGATLIYNSKGRLFRIGVKGGTPELIDTGFANKCNNDHGISPDGSQLAISDQSQTGKSLIYVLPATGGAPRQVTSLGPSYWHGWSPDGKTLVYCAERGGEYDVFAISVAGGKENRLTTAKGLDDGPEYSPDGKFIYFNSERTGTMQIWRMRPDGSDPFSTVKVVVPKPKP
jgi:hypothetical protein